MIVVVDASVAAKWFFCEEHSDAALNLLDNHFELNAPDLIFVELESLLCKRVRRRELSIQEAIEIDTKIRSMPIQAYSTPTLRQRAFRLALETRSSIYDCLYLSLAEALECPLVTADNKFLQALKGSPIGGQMQWVEDLRIEN
jgi:predicted nucleic acid-binding protein